MDDGLSYVKEIQNKVQRKVIWRENTHINQTIADFLARYWWENIAEKVCRKGSIEIYGGNGLANWSVNENKKVCDYG